MVGLRLAAQFVVVRGLGSLNTLSDRVARLDESNFTHRFDDAPLPQETAPVARAINTLLDKAEAALERERRFSENAAHELRTPIAEIRAVADVSRRVGSLPSLRAGMGEVVAVAMQMEATLSALLRISRRKTASDLDSIESVNCTALLSDAVTRRMHHAAEKSISLAFSPAATTPIRTERAMLTGVISNLLDNAVEYTPVGGDVSLSLQSDHKGITFSVINGPVRLMPSDIPRLVEPFWRKDSTRGSGEHAGLGLALTKAMVDALGGAIDFALEPDARLRITVRIPGFPAATKSSDPPAAT
jgi:two-component system sensor histidine kinase QseC